MVEINEKQIFSIIQKAKESGLVKFGANEVTKNIERGQSKLVVVATDVSPVEIIAHFEPLCKELKILYAKIGTRAELGVSVGIKSTTAISVNDGGSAKAELEALIKDFKEESKEKESKTEDKKEESKIEDKKEEIKKSKKKESKVEDKKEEIKESKEKESKAEESKVEDKKEESKE